MKYQWRSSERNFRDLMRSDHLFTAKLQAPYQCDGGNRQGNGQRGPEAVNAHIDMIGKQVAGQQAATPESHGMDEHRHFGHFIAAQRI